MALEVIFGELQSQLKKLQDSLLALRLTVAEDKPLRGESALVDQLECSVTDTMGSVEECLNSSRAARKAVGHPLDLDRARRALNTCQERFHGAELQFSEELLSYEKLRDLASLSGKRGGEWPAWANSVKHGLEQCRVPMDGASKALAACWQELAEHSGTTSISVQTSNIGQKIITRDGDSKDFAGGGIT